MGRKKNSSDFLKECIADALFILLRTKSIESITVREITELANVSRITYYRNFTSKENVIEFKLDKLMTEWIENQPQKESASAHELSIRFFQFFYSIRDIVQTLIRPISSGDSFIPVSIHERMMPHRPKEIKI